MSGGAQSVVLSHDDEDVPQGKPPGRLRQSFDKYWYAWAMVLPVVAVLLVLVAYPMLLGIYYSFTNANGSNVARTIGANEIPATFTTVGLQNYIDVFTSADFWSVLGWTVVWTGVCVFMHYLLGLLSALMLNRPMRGRTLYRILLIIPWAVPAFVSTFAWRFIFNTQYGLLNIALDWVGLGPVRVAGGADPRAVLGDPGQRLDRVPVHDGGHPRAGCRPSRPSSTRRPRWTAPPPGSGSGR